MPTVNLTVEQLLEAFKQLSSEEMKRVEKLRQTLVEESEEDTNHALVAVAVQATDWWDGEGDREWERWQP